MPEQTENYPFDHTGRFVISSLAPGAPVLSAILSVPHDSDRVSGHGRLSQAVNPPLQIDSHFSGTVTVLGLHPGQIHQVYALQGTAPGHLLGAPHVTQLVIALNVIWGKEGKAQYTYVQGNTSHEFKDVPVRVTWLLGE
jgi:hypothetical protein